MKISQITIALIVALLLNFLGGYLNYLDNEQKKIRTDAELRNTDAIRETADLLSLLKDAENGQQKYILTGDTAYIEPYLEDMNMIDHKIDELIKLTTEDVNQQKRIKALKDLLGIKKSEINYILNLFKLKGLHEAQKVVTQNKNSIAMVECEELIKEMLKHEQGLYEKRNKEREEFYSFTNYVRFLTIFFLAITLIGSLIIINRNERRINRLITRLNSSNINLEKEVKARTNELEEANEKLLTMNEEKNKFIGMAAHDLKSPINSIKGLIHLFELDAANLTSEQKEYLKYINESSTRMLHLISDVLNVNKIETGVSMVRLEKFNLYHFVENIVFGLKVSAETKNIKVYLITNNEDFHVQSDKTYIAQIIENLLSNAIKFSPLGKNIIVRVLKDENNFKIEVEDQGQGIKEDEMPHLFEKYKKLSARPTDGEDSTGLGLSIVKGLVDTLDGSIYVESEFEKGTKFTVEFALN